MNIDAPYGYELEDYPEKPNLFRTDLTKNIIQPLPLVGFVVGCGLLLAGIAIELDYQYGEGEIDQEKLTTGRGMLAIGVGVAILGWEYLYERVPDNEKNTQNERLNEELQRRWRQECGYVQRQNDLIRTTFRIRFSLR